MKNSKLKQKTQGFGKIKNAVCRKSVEKKAGLSTKRPKYKNAKESPEKHDESALVFLCRVVQEIFLLFLKNVKEKHI